MKFSVVVSVGLAALVLLLTGCASQITTRNSVITTACHTSPVQALGYLGTAVSGMKNYSVKPHSNDSLRVTYNPSNPLMGSATLEVNAQPVAGVDGQGHHFSGTELVYTDVTSFFSQDTAFSGSDIIDRVKTSVADYMKFKGVTCAQIQRR